MPDPKQQLREALVAVLGAAAAITTITGRATANIVEWQALAEAPRPVLVYRVISFAENGESGEGWDARVQLTAVAEGTDADVVANTLLGAARDALTAPALLAAGVDAAPLRWQRMDGSDDAPGDGDDARMLTRNLHVEHADVELTLTA